MIEKRKRAVVIGSTGLVGRELINLLLADDRFSEIISLSRRSLFINNPKLKEHIIDFSQPEHWQYLVKGDVLFSSMGTTIKQAKTKNKQYEVDYTYQYNVAKVASENGMQTYILVSSAGANPKSLTFYMKMKGELEKSVLKLNFKTIHLLRPVQLLGDRENKRWNESLANSLMLLINKIGLLRSYKPIKGKDLAKKMIDLSFEDKSQILKLHG